MNIDDIVNRIKNNITGIRFVGGNVDDDELKTQIRLVIDDIARRTRYFRESVTITIDKTKNKYDISASFPSGFIDIIDIVDEDNFSLFDYFDVTIDGDLIVLNDELLKKFDSKDLTVVAIVYPSVEGLSQKEYFDIEEAVINGLNAMQRGSFDNSEDSSMGNIHYQRFYLSCQKLYDSKPQYRIGKSYEFIKPKRFDDIGV